LNLRRARADFAAEAQLPPERLQGEVERLRIRPPLDIALQREGAGDAVAGIEAGHCEAERARDLGAMEVDARAPVGRAAGKAIDAAGQGAGAAGEIGDGRLPQNEIALAQGAGNPDAARRLTAPGQSV